MHFQGLDLISQLATQDHYQAKMVFNAHGVIFFPTSQEHRDQSGPNISYADNYKGNALAAMTATRLLGVSTDAAASALGTFRLPARRLKLRGPQAGVNVYLDFAHHPTAIEGTISALRARHGGRVLAVVE